MQTETADQGPELGRLLDGARMRAEHTKLVLQLLWKARESSRADLSRRTGLSRSTVSAIMAELLESGLVRETHAGVSTGGRRPIMLEFRDDAAYLVGVELGASHVTVVLTDLRCAVLGGFEASFPVREEPEAALALVERSVEDLLASRPGAFRQLVGVGVAAPSPIDPRRPGHLVASVVPQWADHDIVARLSARFGRSVLLDNDANLGALAELWWSEKPGASLAYLKVATGIGAGLIFEGRIFRGAGGIAGEIGHTAIDRKGPRCMCGLRGCLTTLVGTERLLERVRALRKRYTKSPLQREPLHVEALVDAALAGDKLARRVVAEAGQTLGVGVANLLNLVNPERVVVGGAITRADDILLEPLRETVRTRALAESIAHAEIERSSLGERAIAIGAATLVLETALADPSLFLPAVRGADTQ